MSNAETPHASTQPHESGARTAVNGASKVTISSWTGSDPTAALRPPGGPPNPTRLLERVVRPGATGVLRDCAHLVKAESARETHERLDRLVGNADEVLSIVPSPRLGTDFIRRTRPPELAALNNGARLRTLFHSDIVEHVPSMEFVRDVVAAGAEARSLTVLPTWLTIIGREVLVMPSDPTRPDGDVLFVRGGGHVRTAVWAFSNAWRAAAPLVTDCGRLALTERERTVLTYLARGAKDECGARELGVSPRTYRRHVTELCARLGASSRFEAGVLAAQTGLISYLL